MTAATPEGTPLPYGVNALSTTRNYTNVRFGRLTALNVVGKTRHHRLIWRCLCDCGQHIDRDTSMLKVATGTASCGCYLIEIGKGHLAGRKGTRRPPRPPDEPYLNRQGWAHALLMARGNQCEVCGWNKAKCDVHHKVPRSEGGRSTINNGLVLCPNCHRIAHDLRASAR